MLTSKGPTYPLFIAGAYRLNVPLELAEHGLHLMAAGMLAGRLADLPPADHRPRCLRGGRAEPRLLSGRRRHAPPGEVIYGSLSLIRCRASSCSSPTSPLVRRGPLRAVPAALAAGVAIGAVLAAYYLCRGNDRLARPSSPGWRAPRPGKDRPLDPELHAARRRRPRGRGARARGERPVGRDPAIARSTALRS